LEQHQASEKFSILSKISYFLAGVLLCMLIFSIFARILTNVWGMTLGVLVNVAFAGYIFNKWKLNRKLKTVVWGIVSTVILIILISITLWTLLFSLFDQIAG
jgi:hypothetical protein